MAVVTSVLVKFLWVGLTSFGAARWTNLEAAFVRPGLIREEDFMRDFAISQALPGPAFVNLTAHCGMRLGGARMAFAGVVLVLVPGVAAVAAVLVFLSTDAPWVGGFLRGVLVGAVGLLAASYIRSAHRTRGLLDSTLAAATVILLVAGVPLVPVIALIAAVGVISYRWTARTIP